MEKLILSVALNAHLQEAFSTLVDDVESEYEVEGTVTEVPYESYDGFWAYTNGGLDLTVPTNLDYVYGSGRYPGNDKIGNELDKVLEYSHQTALECFVQENKTVLEQLFPDADLDNPTQDIINYHDLYNMDQGELAETLSQAESESMYEGGTFFLQYRVFYFKGDNSRNESGEDELYFFAGVNLDFEYGRDNGLESTYEKTVKVSDLTPELIDTIVSDMAKSV